MMRFIQQFYQDCLVKFAPMGYDLGPTWPEVMPRERKNARVAQDHADA